MTLKEAIEYHEYRLEEENKRYDKLLDALHDAMWVDSAKEIIKDMESVKVRMETENKILNVLFDIQEEERK